MASSTSIQWSYHTMYNWYVKNQDHPTDSITCIMYDSVRPNKKETALEPFIKRNIVYVGKTQVQDPQYFPMGLFTVIDDNKKGEQNLCFVYPTYKMCKGKQLPIADHFRFVFNDRAAVNKTNFHRTIYACTETRKDHYEYITKHKHNDFPSELTLPRNENVPHLFNKTDINFYKPALLDIIRYPWNHDRTSPRSGGAKRSAAVSQERRPILSNAFSHIWKRVEFRQMTAMGVRHADGHITWAVTFKRKGRESEHEAYSAYVFDTPTDDETFFQQQLAALADDNE